MEIKGVQNLRLIGEIVKNEILRQRKLIELKDELNNRGARVEHRIEDLSFIFKDTDSKVINRAGAAVLGGSLPRIL